MSLDTRFKRIYQGTLPCALLLCFSLAASADGFQDAQILFKKGQLNQALNKVDALLLALPKDAHARFLKGVILTDLGQHEEAARIFITLSEDFPELPEPYNNLAVIYAGLGQFDKAKIALEKAIRTHPSYATAHENLGDIYAKMASQAYDRALQLDRSSTSSKTKLSLVKDLFNPASKSPAHTKTQVAVLSPAATPEVAANPTPAIKTEPASAKPVVAETNTSDEVLKATNEWVKAWSSKNVTQYLAMYAKDFKTPGNTPRKNWEQQRRERIAKPQPISVSVRDARVKMLNESQARVSFIQSYSSGALKSITRKTLEMSKINGNWQITNELKGV